MSGHSKWSTIKHKKTVADSKRANIFTKLAKDVTIAAREGGDPEMNYKLRLAIDRAKALNMPKDNIERAVKRGTGELKDAARIEEALYEAYGPGRVAMLIKVVTDNRSRTLSEVRRILEKHQAKAVEGGNVAWKFEQVGILEIKRSNAGGEEIEMKIIESGAKDYKAGEMGYTVYSRPQDLKKTKGYLEKNGLKIANASLGFIAKDVAKIDETARGQYDKLLEALDGQDDVVDVFDNLA